jgi:hypothetical protein
VSSAFMRSVVIRDLMTEEETRLGLWVARARRAIRRGTPLYVAELMTIVGEDEAARCSPPPESHCLSSQLRFEFGPVRWTEQSGLRIDQLFQRVNRQVDASCSRY